MAFGPHLLLAALEGLVTSAVLALTALGLSLVFEGASWTIAFRNFRGTVRGRGYWRAIRESRDPAQFIVLMEDSAAVLGILIALGATWAATTLGEPHFDGAASVLIGLLLAAVSVGLARQSKDLLIGERADASLRATAFSLAQSTPGIVCPNSLVSVQLAPDQCRNKSLHKMAKAVVMIARKTVMVADPVKQRHFGIGIMRPYQQNDGMRQ